jgi:hypothetical protein
MLDQRVALKLIPREQGADALERTRREAPGASWSTAI